MSGFAYADLGIAPVPSVVCRIAPAKSVAMELSPMQSQARKNRSDLLAPRRSRASVVVAAIVAKSRGARAVCVEPLASRRVTPERCCSVDADDLCG
jgi:hypothetical protein